MQADLFKKTAILVEPDVIESTLYVDVLSFNGFDVYVAQSLMDALIKVREKAVDLLLIDIDVANYAFIDKVLKNLKKEKNCELTALIGISVYPQSEEKNQYKELDAYLTKPCSIDKLIKRIFETIENKCNGSECLNHQ